MARAEKSGAAAAKPSAAERAKPAAKPAAAARAGEARGQEATAATKAEPADTQSILGGGAQEGSKPGPITKAEAAAKARACGDCQPAKAKDRSVPPMPAKPDYAQAPSTGIAAAKS